MFEILQLAEVQKKAGLGEIPVTYGPKISGRRITLPFARSPMGLASGFTLIELMIVVAIIAIILTLALPVYTNYSIRAKIGEALSVAAAAKTAVTVTCMEIPDLTGLNNDAAGYSFATTTWVESINVSEDCSEPLITIVTRQTGAPDPAPEITLTGFPDLSGGKFVWVCASPNAPDHLLPATCRSS